MDLVSFLIMTVIALIIGVVADDVSPVSMPGGLLGAIFAGFIGAWAGQELLGTWGPTLAGFSLIPSLIGAILVVILAGLLAKVLDR